MGALSISAQMGLGLSPRRSGGVTPTPSPTLATLGLSSTTFTTGSPSSGTITGATTGEAIAGTTLFTGFTINGALRTWAWDGTGSVSTPTVTLTGTLAGATNTPHVSNIGVSVIAPGVITAPVISQTSTTGANPFLWTTAENATFYPGYYWNVRTATGASEAAASTALLAGTTTADIIQAIEPGDLAGDTITFTGLTTTSTAGPFALYERVGAEDGLGGYNWGAWSNVLTDTLAGGGGASTWNSAAKSTYITLSNSDKTATAPVDAGGVVTVIGATGKTTGKWYFEVAVTMGTAFRQAGVGVANSLPADFTIPGSASTTAITYHSNSLVYRNSGNDGGANQSAWESPTGTYIIGVAFDADADKVWFAIANTYSGSPAAGTGGHAPSGITTYYPLFMTTSPTEPGTIRTLTADMTYSPPAGFTALGGA